MIRNIHSDLKKQMDKNVEHLKKELHSLRAGRANPGILDRVMVDYYGTLTPLNQMATITAPEARLITISPYDKSVLAEIEKAIINSDLNLHPNNDGKIIRLNLPMLTEENRMELTKLVKKYGEEAKISMRNERRTANDQLKKLEKSSEITEDDLADGEKEVQEITDRHTDLVDEMVKEKIDEIMEV